METPASYRITFTHALLQRDALRSRRCCRGLNDPRWRPPNRLEMHSLLALLGCSPETATAHLATLCTLTHDPLAPPWSADPASAHFQYLPPRVWMAALIEADVIDVDELIQAHTAGRQSADRQRQADYRRPRSAMDTTMRRPTIR